MMQWVWWVCFTTLFSKAVQGSRHYPFAAAYGGGLFAEVACRDGLGHPGREEFPIDEKTMRSVVCIRRVKARMAPPLYRASAALRPRML